MVGTSSCRWPSWKSSGKTEKAIRLQEDFDETFSTFSVRIMYKTDSYAKACQKVKQAELMSDLNTEDETDTQIAKKRKRRPTSRFVDSDSSPEKPSRTMNTQISSPENSPVTKRNIYAPLPVIPKPPAPLAISSINGTGVSSSKTPTKRPCLQEALIETPKTTKPITAVEKKIILMLEEIKNQTAQNSKNIQLILKSLEKDNDENTVANSLLEGVVLPLETMEDFNNLEIKLDNHSFEKCMTEHLGTIGGEDVPQCVRRTLKYLLTNNMPVQFNWIGKGEKKPFSSSKLLSAVKKSVRKNRLTQNATDSEIELVIKDWFRYAKDRDGGRKKREEEKKEECQNRTLTIKQIC